MLRDSLALIIIAGIMNGSFVIPMRYIKNLSSEAVWLYHSIIGLALIPWLLLMVILPNAFSSYFHIPADELWFLILGGIIFGLGQVCFAYAIEIIGIALSFIINLGLGVTIGSMFVVFYKSAFFSIQGYIVTASVFLILLSLIINYVAGKNNHGRNRIIYSDKHPYHTGWILALLTGLTSGLQNIVFVTVVSHSSAAFNTNNLFWVWPPFLLAAAIPMFFGFLYRLKKENLANFSLLNFKSILLVAIMGLFFTGSLAMYSVGLGGLSQGQQIIGWPALMVSIILASQVWGWVYLENKEANTKNKIYSIFSIILLFIAIILLAIES